MKIGIGNMKVVSICPTYRRLNEILKKDTYQKEIEYSTGNSCKIVAVLQEGEFTTFASFELEKKPLKSKSDNYAFYNARGDIRWAKAEDELPTQFFLGGEVQTLYQGQEFLIDFLRCWQVGKSVFFNTNNWWLGNFSELNSLEGNIGASVVVETSLNNKEKNKVWTKKFCPASQTERFRGQEYDEPYLKKLRQQDLINKDKSVPKENKRFFEDWEKLLVLQNDPNYPCPYLFYNGYLKPYSSADNPIVSFKRLIK